MKEYLLSLLVASMLLTLVGILSPKGSNGGLSGHVRLVGALVWICLLVVPLFHLVSQFRQTWDDELIFEQESVIPDCQAQLNEAIDKASKDYFCDMLTQTLEERFSLTAGTLRCTVKWMQVESGIKPEQVTLFLSGSAIWQSPTLLEEFVTDLIGCKCITVIE